MATESHSMEEWYNLPERLDGSLEDIDKIAAVRGVIRAHNGTGEMLNIHFDEKNAELETAIVKIAILGGYQIWDLRSTGNGFWRLQLIPPFVAEESFDAEA